MTKPDTIIYFEDEPAIAEYAVEELQKEFPKHKLISNPGTYKWEEEVLKEIKGIERIALLLTDGSLKQVHGSDVVERFRQLGYTGPAVYTGLSRLSEDKKHLYAERAEKIGQGLIDVVKKHIGH